MDIAVLAARMEAAHLILDRKELSRETRLCVYRRQVAFSNMQVQPGSKAPSDKIGFKYPCSGTTSQDS